MAYRRILFSLEHEGLLARVTLTAGPGNILDLEVFEELRHAFQEIIALPSVRGVILDHDGDHLSYGASIEEHAPGKIGDLLKSFHSLLRSIVSAGLIVVSAVRGWCLGGGLELVLVSHRIIAHRDARFGSPEIKLGAFAPAGSLLLPLRVGQGIAEDLLLSGRSVSGLEAQRLGLVDDVAEDPSKSAERWIRTTLFSQSGTTLRFAMRAARFGMLRTLTEDLPRLESLYLKELLQTRDALEGLAAWHEHRSPRWLT